MNRVTSSFRSILSITLEDFVKLPFDDKQFIVGCTLGGISGGAFGIKMIVDKAMSIEQKFTFGESVFVSCLCTLVGIPLGGLFSSTLPITIPAACIGGIVHELAKIKNE